ncbi:MAG TPA: CHAD domain-containing protein [Lysobacter sp.]|nr:CHAD domain-containing protein [Lysobacter sp.]
MPATTDPAEPHLPTSAPGPGLCTYATAELDSALAHLAWRGGRVHEGVHLARKALRRTRAALALGVAALGAQSQRIDKRLRRLNRGLSLLRDAQALVETLDRLIRSDYGDAAITLLQSARREAAARRIEVAQRILGADPALGERRSALRALRAALAALPWEALTTAQIDTEREHAQRRLHDARLRALNSDVDDDWHRWRRRARRVSQQRRALTAIGVDPDHLKGDDGFDKRTTERLGAAQDLTLLIDHCGRDSPFSKPHRAALQAFAKPELARLRRKIAAAR